MSQQLTLGGRNFKPITNATLEHDYKVMELLTAAGIRSIEMPEDADPNVFMSQLFSELVLQGNLLTLFAHLIIPTELAGHQWSPAVAADVEKHLRGLTADEDKAAVHEQLAAMLIGFFHNGLAALKITPSCSGTAPQ